MTFSKVGLLALFVAWGASTTELPLEADNECGADDPTRCAVSALQRRGVKKATETVDFGRQSEEELDFLQSEEDETELAEEDNDDVWPDVEDEEMASLQEDGYQLDIESDTFTEGAGEESIDLIQSTQDQTEIESLDANVTWQGNRETGSACWSSCDPKTLGPAECHHLRCICKSGYFWSPVKNRCVGRSSDAAKLDTGGSCRWFGCSGSRGFTRCVQHKCLCYEGYESKNGKCALVGGGHLVDDGKCHAPKWGDACFKAISHAMSDGIYADPDNYPGLMPGASSSDEFQAFIHKTDSSTCPRPCPIHIPHYSRPSMINPRQPIMKGIAYGPLPVKGPSKVNGDDLMAEIVGAQWADWGRGDMKIMKELGANTIRLYGNDANTSHRAFLDAAAAHHLRVVAGMSDFGFTQGPDHCMMHDWYCYDLAYFFYHKQLMMGFTIDNYTRYHPALKTMIICNEPDLKLNEAQARPKVCRAMASIWDAMLSAEKDLGVTGNPIAFTITWAFADWGTGRPALISMEQFYDCLVKGPELPPTKYTPKNDLLKAFHTRFVNSFNTQNLFNEVRAQLLDRYAHSVFWTHKLKVPVFIGEYHNIDRSHKGKADDLEQMLKLAKSKRYPFFLGYNFFEFTKAAWKPPDGAGYNVQWEFGAFKYGNCILMDMDYTGMTYTIYNLEPQKDKGGHELPKLISKAYGKGGKLPPSMDHDWHKCQPDSKSPEYIWMKQHGMTDGATGL
eukprot:TRINITY_DN5346_c0_g1_i2.p1 TRINITY_DN5346_c0_g1~~TRINITY_DN5346_c0_g1_i2.p1  ORF type:complete len:731 (-),score=164.25 TRINITY_DN5346_c0_g1_i2:127-2319(-)